MSSDMNMAKQAIHDKLASQITSAEAHLEALKARAEAKVANVEIKKAIAEQLTKKLGIQQKLQELKKSGDVHWDNAKHDLEARIADFDKSVKAIESKIKGS
jgi:multidrug efflux pump subunit AcrA (membrane-fusion protein)